MNSYHYFRYIRWDEQEVWYIEIIIDPAELFHKPSLWWDIIIIIDYFKKIKNV